MDQTTTVRGTIISLEDDYAVIETADGQRLRWQAAKLPAGCQLGSSLRLMLYGATPHENERTELAKAILNELLRI